jgi:hypothetical protein
LELVTQIHPVPMTRLGDLSPLFLQIHPVGAELLHADGRTNMAKLILAFRNFGSAPKNVICMVVVGF